MIEKRLYYVGVIKSDDEFEKWAFGGGYNTEQNAVDACGENDLAFVNVCLMNDEIDFKWETDPNKLGYYPVREPEKIGSLGKRKL